MWAVLHLDQFLARKISMCNHVKYRTGVQLSIWRRLTQIHNWPNNTTFWPLLYHSNAIYLSWIGQELQSHSHFNIYLTPLGGNQYENSYLLIQNITKIHGFERSWSHESNTTTMNQTLEIWGSYASMWFLDHENIGVTEPYTWCQASHSAIYIYINHMTSLLHGIKACY